MRGQKGGTRSMRVGGILVVALLAAGQLCAMVLETGFPVIVSFSNVVWERFANEHTLVLLDVDEVLVVRSLGSCDPFTLIEPEVCDVIRTLRAGGCTVLALTDSRRGPGAGVPCFLRWRAEYLRSLGVELSQEIGDITFDRLPSRDGLHPALCCGVMATNQIASKGDLLHAFLDKTNLQPERIVFIDNSMKHLESVKGACEQREIPVSLYYYGGAPDWCYGE